MEDLTQNGSKTAEFVPLHELGGVKRPLFNVDMVRERLANARGQQYWRSLDELANTDEFQHYLKREFPNQAPRDMLPVSRREFMRVMGATLALAGVGGCAYQPPEKIVPYVEQPEEIVPGKPLFFATSFTHGGYGIGVLGESHMGRPIKLEGNPQHPASLGATSVFAQASLLSLYDPDRARSVRYLGNASTWDGFLGDLSARLTTARLAGGGGVRIVTGPFTSPSLMAQVAQFLKKYAGARITIHDPAAPDEAQAATAEAVYHLDVADRILSLDSDFLLEEPGSVRYAREFMTRRKSYDATTPRGVKKRVSAESMNRLYQVESTTTITGASADHRIGLKPSEVEAVARAVASGLGVSAEGGALPAGVSQAWVTAVVKDLEEHAATSVVIPGRYASPAVQAIAHAINGKLGAVGKTVTYIAPVQAQFGAQQITVHQLADDLNGGKVDLLLVLGSNPVFSAPADAEFGKALAAATKPGRSDVTVAVSLGLHEDETAAYCQWFVPESHFLEAWGDVRAFDGTASLIQPLITPLYTSRSKWEFLAAMLGQGDRPGYEIIREFWKPSLGTGFEAGWRQALLKGTLPNTAGTSVAAPSGTIPAAAAAGMGIEIVFRPDPTIYDGSYANNGWLQELPKPITQLTWDNAAILSPATMNQLGLKRGDMVDVIYQKRRLSIPVLEVPYQPNDTVTVHLGGGRTRTGVIGEGQGFNAYGIRTSDALWHGSGVELQKSAKKYPLAVAQMHLYMENRGLVQAGTVEQLDKDPHEILDLEKLPEEGSLYKPMWPSDTPDLGPAHDKAEHGKAEHSESAEPHAAEPLIAGAPNRLRREPAGPIAGEEIAAWGMVIDLNSCIGCNACVIACQAENNIATVGKDQVMNNREMHWIRLSTYYTGDEKDPRDPVFQPVPCMHCEKAPCEPVCPVEATTHSPEGINEMTYNRCIGTRYCENNCPYKVRRFNYLQYQDQKSPIIELMRNPDVTVRSRGVMEKCTYCVQRVNQARIEAEKEGRPIEDGDVITACQQVCPTEAIVFGNINDYKSNKGKGSWVRQLKQEPTHYGLLTELNTRPRTSYLAKVRNPNPALPQAAHGESEAGH